MPLRYDEATAHPEMNPRTWFFFVATEAALSLTPGPAVLLVVSTALRNGFQQGVGAVFGILAANALYFAVSGTSLGAVILGAGGLYTIVKWSGAAYLVFLGFKDLLQPGASEPVAVSAPALQRAFRNGFVLQTANPKAIVFFVALLPQFLDRSGSIPLQVLILAVSSMVVELVILTGYSAAASRAAHAIESKAFTLWIHRVGGVLLILAGAGIAAMGR